METLFFRILVMREFVFNKTLKIMTPICPTIYDTLYVEPGVYQISVHVFIGLV